MPLLPSALPPKGEARRYVANNFLSLIAFPDGEGLDGATLRVDFYKGIKGDARKWDSSHSSLATNP